jgi:hypothetical protein
VIAFDDPALSFACEAFVPVAPPADDEQPAAATVPADAAAARNRRRVRVDTDSLRMLLFPMSLRTTIDYFIINVCFI